MLETDKVFAGSIPENYDRHMVPLIFEAYAAETARRAASLSPVAILETAAGTGAVTRALAPRLSPGASYTVTDLNQPMLDYAASRQGPDSRIAWRQADASKLPFEDAAFDLVCCQFGAMFFPDRVAAYRIPRPVAAEAGFLEEPTDVQGAPAMVTRRSRVRGAARRLQQRGRFDRPALDPQP